MAKILQSRQLKAVQADKRVQCSAQEICGTVTKQSRVEPQLSGFVGT